MKRKTTVYTTLGGSQNMRALQRLVKQYFMLIRPESFDTYVAEPVARLL